jgi:hypothetical protein
VIVTECLLLRQQPLRVQRLLIAIDLDRHEPGRLVRVLQYIEVDDTGHVPADPRQLHKHGTCLLKQMLVHPDSHSENDHLRGVPPERHGFGAAEQPGRLGNGSGTNLPWWETSWPCRR